jgi:hypothetical protein
MKTLADPASKSEIIARIKRLTPDSVRKWGKMTAHQMVCHLSDSHLLPMGELKGADISSFMNRTFVKFVALRTPMKWPPGVKTVPELDQAAGAGSVPGEFESDRAKLLQLVDRFTASPRDFPFARHPIFAEMSDWEWMRWAYLHADHHLRQFGL